MTEDPALRDARLTLLATLKKAILHHRRHRGDRDRDAVRLTPDIPY